MVSPFRLYDCSIFYSLKTNAEWYLNIRDTNTCYKYLACCIDPWECRNALRTSRHLVSFIHKLIHAAEGRRDSEEIDSKSRNVYARAIFGSFITDACCCGFIVVLYCVALKLSPHIIPSLISMISLPQILCLAIQSRLRIRLCFDRYWYLRNDLWHVRGETTIKYIAHREL